MSVQSWSSEDWLRHYMYESIHAVLQHQSWEDRTYRILDFPGKFYGDPDGGWQTHLRTMFKSVLGKEHMDYVGATYPEVDIEKLPYADESIDVICCDQILEHVQKPWVAAEQIYRVCKRGGLAVVAVPGFYPIHKAPFDTFRILPDGFRVLFEESLWQWLSFDMWGTRERLAFELLDNGAFPYSAPQVSVEQAMQQPYYTPGTDGRFPIQLWLIARKR